MEDLPMMKILVVDDIEENIDVMIELLSDDFDKDSTDDLAVLSTEGTIRIIWGKKEEPKDFVPEITDISTGNKALTGIFKGDTDNDGNMDLILGNEDMSIVIIKGNEGRTWKNQEKIAGFRASDIDVFDLDEDGNNDIIFSYFIIIRWLSSV